MRTVPVSQLPALKEMVIFGIFKDPGRHWFSDFFKRNENKIKMKKEVKLEHSRKQGFTETVRSGWFQKVKDLLDRNDLHFRPNQIWNVDESGFSDETQCEFWLT